MNRLIKRTLRSSDRTDLGFGMLIIRLGIAFTMIHGHGYFKLTNFDILIEKFGDPLGIGVTTSVVLVIFAEFFCSLFIGIGFLTRLAAIPLIVTMAVATFIANGTAEFAMQEKGLMYLIIYFGIFFIGPGKFSVDAAIRK